MAITHPEIDTWIGDMMRILVVNREDMISSSDKNAWAQYYIKQGIHPVFTDGQRGDESMNLARMAKSVAVDINVKTKEKGLLPCNVRAAVVWYPGVRKSSIINHLPKDVWNSSLARSYQKFEMGQSLWWIRPSRCTGCVVDADSGSSQGNKISNLQWYWLRICVRWQELQQF